MSLTFEKCEGVHDPSPPVPMVVPPLHTNNDTSEIRATEAADFAEGFTKKMTGFLRVFQKIILLYCCWIKSG